MRPQKFVTADRLSSIRDGKRLSIAGLVLIRQRPGSAKGVVFITLEDETGVANLVVWPDVFDKQRKIVMGARLMAVHGIVQRDPDSNVIHVVARRLEDHSHMLRHLSDDAMPSTLTQGDAPGKLASACRSPSTRCRNHPEKPRFSLAGHAAVNTHPATRTNARTRHHLRLRRAVGRTGAAARADRGQLEKPDRKRDHRHRAVRRRALRQGRLGLGARAARSLPQSTSNVVGTTVLTGLKQAGNRWTGRLFIPDDNIHVAAKLQLLASAS